MTAALRCLAIRLRGDETGATLVEFALILLPMLVILIGGLDVGYQSYVRTVMQGALNDAARRAAVENPQFSAEGDTLEEQVEQSIRAIVGRIAVDGTIAVTQSSYFEFSGIGNPERLMTDVAGDGEFDAADGDCWQDTNANGEFDTDGGAGGRGAANDVVFYRAEISLPRLFPIDAFIPSLGDEIGFTIETAVRNQPFDDQPVPAVVCAEPG